ncbi:hypothetical protein S83_020263 [Arachis hypogaea]
MPVLGLSYSAFALLYPDINTNSFDPDHYMNLMIMSVQSRSDNVNTSLFDKREHLEKLHHTCNLLRKVQFIYDLPDRLNKCIKSEAYADAVRFYTGTMPILMAYGDSSFRDCKPASEEAMATIVKNLQAKECSFKNWLLCIEKFFEKNLIYLTQHVCLQFCLKDGPGAPRGQSWTVQWLKFDNSYFKDIKEKKDEDLLVLPTYAVLFEDPSFKVYAAKYVEDQVAFFNDYAEAHAKLSNLGAKFDPPEGIVLDLSPNPQAKKFEAAKYSTRKDVCLGKTRSSDGKFVVGEKGLCQVLGECISSYGNCSNMKTKCGPVIDFFGEKDVEVAGLNDISIDIDVIKDKGKIVEESVDAVRECVLKLKFSSSPLKETTEVLSAVHDASPIHMVKNETVEIPPKDAKVKRNLKKNF